MTGKMAICTGARPSSVRARCSGRNTASAAGQSSGSRSPEAAAAALGTGQRNAGFQCAQGFVRTDGECFVERALVRPANKNEAPHLPAMVDDCTARRMLVDKGLSQGSGTPELATGKAVC